MMRTVVELKMPWPLVNVEEDSGDLVVRFHADAFCWPAVEDVGKALFDLVEEMADDDLALDLGNVDRLTGVGISKLVQMNKKLATLGRRLRVKNVQPGLATALSLQGMEPASAGATTAGCHFMMS